jgi:predicted Zn-dependent peptidase
MDNIHYTSYRYNSLGNPILGTSENIEHNITIDMVREFKDTH